MLWSTKMQLCRCWQTAPPMNSKLRGTLRALTSAVQHLQFNICRVTGCCPLLSYRFLSLLFLTQTPVLQQAQGSGDQTTRLAALLYSPLPHSPKYTQLLSLLFKLGTQSRREEKGEAAAQSVQRSLATAPTTFPNNPHGSLYTAHVP